MTHPLAAISRNVLVNGTLINGIATSTDTKGNPIFSTQNIRLLVMVKTLKDQMYFRNLYSVDNTRKVVEIYIQKAWLLNQVNSKFEFLKPDKIDFNDFGQLLTSTDNKLKLTIVDRNQSNLKIITSVFGRNMMAIQDWCL